MDIFLLVRLCLQCTELRFTPTRVSFEKWRQLLLRIFPHGAVSLIHQCSPSGERGQIGVDLILALRDQFVVRFDVIERLLSDRIDVVAADATTIEGPLFRVPFG